MKTLICDYFATGEGCTMMILFTSDQNPKKRFEEIFGKYFAIGVEEFDGLNFDNSVAKILVSESTKNMLLKDCNREYFCQLHCNFS